MWQRKFHRTPAHHIHTFESIREPQGAPSFASQHPRERSVTRACRRRFRNPPVASLEHRPVEGVSSSHGQGERPRGGSDEGTRRGTLLPRGNLCAFSTCGFTLGGAKCWGARSSRRCRQPVGTASVSIDTGLAGILRLHSAREQVGSTADHALAHERRTLDFKTTSSSLTRPKGHGGVVFHIP